MDAPRHQGKTLGIVSDQSLAFREIDRDGPRGNTQRQSGADEFQVRCNFLKTNGPSKSGSEKRSCFQGPTSYSARSVSDRAAIGIYIVRTDTRLQDQRDGPPVRWRWSREHRGLRCGWGAAPPLGLTIAVRGLLCAPPIALPRPETCPVPSRAIPIQTSAWKTI